MTREGDIQRARGLAGWDHNGQGERTLLDLLDSENELFTAQQRLAQIKNLQLYTQYRIKADMGQLLRSQGVVAPMASVVQNDIKPSVNLPGMN